MELIFTAIAIIGGMSLSLVVALLVEELIFGKVLGCSQGASGQGGCTPLIGARGTFCELHGSIWLALQTLHQGWVSSGTSVAPPST